VGRDLGFPPGFKVAAWLLTLCLLAAIGSALRNGGFRPQRSDPAGASVLAQPGHRSYFNRGQWRADAKTLVAVIHYLLESEPVLRTNQVAAVVVAPPGLARRWVSLEVSSNCLAGPVEPSSRILTNPPART
jgi:hypothetical protein